MAKKWIEKWEPNDEAFWAREGRSIARRNLIFSIFAEFLGFSVWLLWSVVAVNLPRAGFDYDVNQLFWLVSLPALVGATARFFYGALVPILGGRTFTMISAALLLIPTIGLAILVQDPTTPYWLMLLCAGSAGLGGGNFASSMANISHFYPDKHKGAALGLNAAGGNIGVAVVQMIVPLVIGLGFLGLGGAAAGEVLSLEWAGYLWVPLIVASAACAWLFMDNLSVSRASVREQSIILRRRDTWIMSWLYIGTFGSFIGYSAALPLLIKTQFPDVNPLQYAFLGPLVGSIARPFGGWLSDRVGGAKITFWNFILMIGAVFGVIAFLEAGMFGGFLAMFMLLFVTTGLGNGSTFRMVPAIFRAGRMAAAKGGTDEQLRLADIAGRREAAAVLAFSSAIGAYGGFFIPRGFAMSIREAGSITPALLIFVGFYVTCVGATWWWYMRRAPRRATAPVLADVKV